MEENKEKDINEINNKYFTNDFSKEIWETTYKLKSEQTIEETWRRVAKAVASVEETPELQSKWEQEFYRILENFKLVPGGRILANAGGPNKATSLINCFVSPKPDSDIDSLESILWVLNKQALTLKSEGGWGCNFSFIRPRGSYIKGIGVRSPGAVKYMELFDKSSEIITEGPGEYKLEFDDYHVEEKTKIRKGAMMMILNVWHPDIEEFITAKRKANHLTKANLSVNVPNKFMDKLLEIQKLKEENASQEQIDELDKWELVFPDTSIPEYKKEWDGNIDAWLSKGYKVNVYKTVKLTDLWDKIMKSTYDFADPGIMFLDIANQDHCANYIPELQIHASNPCLPNWVHVLTPSGLRTISEVNIGDKIWSIEGWTTITNKWSSGIKDVYKYSTTKGWIACTENHKLLQNGVKVEAKDCTHIDTLCANNEEVQFDAQAIVDGLFFGDGYFHKASNNKPVLLIGEKDQDYFTDQLIKDLILSKTSIAETAYAVDTTILPEEISYTYEKKIPTRYLHADNNIVASFLRGLYSANGSVVGSRVTYKTTSPYLRDQLLLLLSRLGIQGAYYTTNKPKEVAFSNGTYTCKESYDVNIGNIIGICKFYNTIGFLQHYKMQKLKPIIDKAETHTIDHTRLTALINTVEYLSTEEVFDLTVDNVSHTFWCCGFNIANCGEQFLPAGGACNLASINLTQFVEYDPTSNMVLFDYNRFKETIQIGVRFLDNVLDIANVPLTEYDTMIKNYRRIGLGVTGVGSTLAMLGLDYADPSTEVFIHNLMSTFNSEAIKASIKLGEEKGSFKDFDPELHLQNLKRTFPYVFAEDWEFIESNFKAFRNSSLFSIQPTGNTGCLANCISGGIEPVFEKSYIRTVTVPFIPENLKGKLPKYWEGDFTPNKYFKSVSQWGITFLTYTDPDTKIVYKIFQDRGLCKEIVCEDYSIYYLKKLQQEHNYSGNLNFRCAMDLTADEHLKILSTMAQHIDSSQSKTINVSSDYSYEDFKNIYINAYKSKRIKGVTTYRDKTKAAVLNTNSQSDCECCKKIAKTVAPKRPKTLPCKVHLMTIKGIAYYAIVSMLGDDPYEVFIGQNKEDIKNEDGEYVGSKLLFYQKLNGCEGELTRLARGKYVFKPKDGKIEVPITRTEENEDAALIAAFSRILSWGLRHGGDIRFAVEQLEKTEGSFSSATKVFSRVLKKYIKQDCDCSSSTAKVKHVCPKCGAALVFSEGCKHCAQCGWSACG